MRGLARNLLETTRSITHQLLIDINTNLKLRDNKVDNDSLNLVAVRLLFLEDLQASLSTGSLEKQSLAP